MLGYEDILKITEHDHSHCDSVLSLVMAILIASYQSAYFLNIIVCVADNNQMREHHLVLLLSGIIQWVHPPDAVSRAIECGKSERSKRLAFSTPPWFTCIGFIES